MAIRIGINGFGRMGRLALRAGWGRRGVEFVHINEIAGDVETAAHLLTFDSVHGRWHRPVEARANQLVIDGQPLTFSSAAVPEDVPWSAHQVDLVLECSGKFRSRETLDPYFAVGVRKVIVAAPVKAALSISSSASTIICTIRTHHLVTAASCRRTAWRLS
jgi:glyceraldehyde 3-phosphate dehydrogenase